MRRKRKGLYTELSEADQIRLNQAIRSNPHLQEIFGQADTKAVKVLTENEYETHAGQLTMTVPQVKKLYEKYTAACQDQRVLKDEDTEQMTGQSNWGADPVTLLAFGALSAAYRRFRASGTDKDAPRGAAPRTAIPAGDRTAAPQTARPTGDQPAASQTARPAGDQPAASQTARPAGDQPAASQTARPAGDQPAASQTARPAGDQPAASQTARPAGDQPAASNRTGDSAATAANVPPKAGEVRMSTVDRMRAVATISNPAIVIGIADRVREIAGGSAPSSADVTAAINEFQTAQKLVLDPTLLQAMVKGVQARLDSAGTTQVAPASPGRANVDKPVAAKPKAEDKPNAGVDEASQQYLRTVARDRKTDPERAKAEIRKLLLMDISSRCTLEKNVDPASADSAKLLPDLAFATYANIRRSAFALKDLAPETSKFIHECVTSVGIDLLRDANSIKNTDLPIAEFIQQQRDGTFVSRSAASGNPARPAAAQGGTRTTRPAPAQGVNPDTTAPAQGVNPDTTAPAPGANPDTTAPAQGVNPDTTAPAPGANPDTTAPAPGANPDTTAPAPGANPDTTAARSVVGDPAGTSPTAELSPDAFAAEVARHQTDTAAADTLIRGRLLARVEAAAVGSTRSLSKILGAEIQKLNEEIGQTAATPDRTFVHESAKIVGRNLVREAHTAETAGQSVATFVSAQRQTAQPPRIGPAPRPDRPPAPTGGNPDRPPRPDRTQNPTGGNPDRPPRPPRQDKIPLTVVDNSELYKQTWLELARHKTDSDAVLFTTRVEFLRGIERACTEAKIDLTKASSAHALREIALAQYAQFMEAKSAIAADSPELAKQAQASALEVVRLTNVLIGNRLVPSTSVFFMPLRESATKKRSPDRPEPKPPDRKPARQEPAGPTFDELHINIGLSGQPSELAWETLTTNDADLRGFIVRVRDNERQRVGIAHTDESWRTSIAETIAEYETALRAPIGDETKAELTEATFIHIQEDKKAADQRIRVGDELIARKKAEAEKARATGGGTGTPATPTKGAGTASPTRPRIEITLPAGRGRARNAGPRPGAGSAPAAPGAGVEPPTGGRTEPVLSAEDAARALTLGSGGNGGNGKQSLIPAAEVTKITVDGKNDSVKVVDASGHVHNTGLKPSDILKAELKFYGEEKTRLDQERRDLKAQKATMTEQEYKEKLEANINLQRALKTAGKTATELLKAIDILSTSRTAQTAQTAAAAVEAQLGPALEVLSGRAPETRGQLATVSRLLVERLEEVLPKQAAPDKPAEPDKPPSREEVESGFRNLCLEQARSLGILGSTDVKDLRAVADWLKKTYVTPLGKEAKQPAVTPEQEMAHEMANHVEQIIRRQATKSARAKNPTVTVEALLTQGNYTPVSPAMNMWRSGTNVTTERPVLSFGDTPAEMELSRFDPQTRTRDKLTGKPMFEAIAEILKKDGALIRSADSTAADCYDKAAAEFENGPPAPGSEGAEAVIDVHNALVIARTTGNMEPLKKEAAKGGSRRALVYIAGGALTGVLGTIMTINNLRAKTPATRSRVIQPLGTETVY